MTQYRVVFTRIADAQAVTIEGWWVANRPAAPDLFRRELDAVVRLIERSPFLGAVYAKAPVGDVRRILIGRSRYHVYWEVDKSQHVVTITAAWSASRGTGPAL